MTEEKASWRFIAVNDLHCLNQECEPWFDQVVAAMKHDAPDAKFCLILGDLTDSGQPEQFEIIQRAFAALDVPVYVTPGNHDFPADGEGGPFDEAFPGQRCQHFEVNGWQFIGLDSTEGTRWQDSSIQQATFDWLDQNLPLLSRTKPTVLWTHFPLGEGAPYRPLNAGTLLEEFDDFNVRAIFGGHWHAFTQQQWHGATATTNRCCSRVQHNHDGSKEKGWFVCEVNDGELVRRFAEIPATILD